MTQNKELLWTLIEAQDYLDLLARSQELITMLSEMDINTTPNYETRVALLLESYQSANEMYIEEISLRLLRIKEILIRISKLVQ